MWLQLETSGEPLNRNVYARYVWYQRHNGMASGFRQFENQRDLSCSSEPETTGRMLQASCE